MKAVTFDLESNTIHEVPARRRTTTQKNRVACDEVSTVLLLLAFGALLTYGAAVDYKDRGAVVYAVAAALCYGCSAVCGIWFWFRSCCCCCS